MLAIKPLLSVASETMPRAGLQNSDKSVAQVAATMGYGISAASFSRHCPKYVIGGFTEEIAEASHQAVAA